MRFTTLHGEEMELCCESPPAMAAVLMAHLKHGPQVTLWRKYRDGTESRERLPEMLAEWTLHAIPECEPDVARARIEREGR